MSPRCPRRSAILVSLGAAALLVPTGCARMKTARRAEAPVALEPQTVAVQPPTVEGSFIRSQDGTKLAGRANPRRATPTPAATTTRASAPQVAWTGPRDAPVPAPTRVTPIPAPPSLPEDATTKPTTAMAAVAAEPPVTTSTPAPVVLEPPVADTEPVLPAPAPAATEVLLDPTPAPTTQPATVAQPPAEPQPAHVEQPAPVEQPALVEQPGAAAPAPASAPASAEETQVFLRKLINQAKAQLNTLTSYQTRMIRQERVGDSLLAGEEVILSLRRKPLAVRLEWPTGPSKGREVLFSPVETNGKLEIHAPGTLLPRLTLPPDSPLITKNSRHPITEAGFESILRNMDASLHAVETRRPDAGQFEYQGIQSFPEVGRDCHRIVEHRTNGETWVVGLDVETGLPLFVYASDAGNQLLESYAFRDVTLNVADLESTAAFSPAERWQDGKGGVLGRIARGLTDSQPAPR